MSMAIVVLPHS